MWLCVCECGAMSTVRGGHLKSGASVSCGCYQKEVASVSSKTHGSSDSPEYRAWSNMLDRCRNKNSPGFHRYGGRGISVCDEWAGSFLAFIKDIGERPSSHHSIDRIDNDGDYCPSNCRWATSKQQSRNRADNRIIEFNGRSQTLYQWAEETGLNNSTISGRIRNGWPIEKALTQKSQRDK